MLHPSAKYFKGGAETLLGGVLAPSGTQCAQEHLLNVYAVLQHSTAFSLFSFTGQYSSNRNMRS